MNQKLCDSQEKYYQNLAKGRNQKLSDSQEKYCQNRAKGMNQVDSLLDAYPQRKKWKRESLHRTSVELEKNIKVKSRIDELKKPALDILEAHRKEIIEIAIKKAQKGNSTIIAKLLDKLVATKTEAKIETRNKTLEDYLNDL